MRTLNLNKIFMPENRIKYPPHNDMTLEEYCYHALKARNVNTKRIYVPAFWTTYYARNDYGHDKRAVDRLNKICQNIRQPWFTISQYDDGVMLGVEKPSNCLSFSAGGVGDIPLPLTSYRWSGNENISEEKYLCSFIGNKNTHPLRVKMFEELEGAQGFYIEQVNHHKDHYAQVMTQSKFSLCPRGYGKTSFRLYEAMAIGSIPIYISDEHWLPFGDKIEWSKFCVPINPEQIKSIPSIISNISLEQSRQMSENCKRTWEQYFSYDACVNQIVRILEEENAR